MGETPLTYSLAIVLDVLNTDPTAPIRDDLDNVIATKYDTSPKDRFVLSPIDGGVLLNDTAGELISMQGAQITVKQEGIQGAGEQYISDYVGVSVLTGPDKGQTFARGTHPAVVPHRTQPAA